MSRVLLHCLYPRLESLYWVLILCRWTNCLNTLEYQHRESDRVGGACVWDWGSRWNRVILSSVNWKITCCRYTFHVLHCSGDFKSILQSIFTELSVVAEVETVPFPRLSCHFRTDAFPHRHRCRHHLPTTSTSALRDLTSAELLLCQTLQ